MLRYTEYINLKIYITDALAVCVNFRQSLQHFTSERTATVDAPSLSSATKGHEGHGRGDEEPPHLQRRGFWHITSSASEDI